MKKFDGKKSEKAEIAPRELTEVEAKTVSGGMGKVRPPADPPPDEGGSR